MIKKTRNTASPSPQLSYITTNQDLFLIGTICTMWIIQGVTVYLVLGRFILRDLCAMLHVIY